MVNPPKKVWKPGGPRRPPVVFARSKGPKSKPLSNHFLKSGIGERVLPSRDLIPTIAQSELRNFFKVPRTEKTFPKLLQVAKKFVATIDELATSPAEVSIMLKYGTALDDYLTIGQHWLRIPEANRKALHPYLITALASAKRLSQVTWWIDQHVPTPQKRRSKHN